MDTTARMQEVERRRRPKPRINLNITFSHIFIIEDEPIIEKTLKHLHLWDLCMQSQDPPVLMPDNSYPGFIIAKLIKKRSNGREMVIV